MNCCIDTSLHTPEARLQRLVSHLAWPRDEEVHTPANGMTPLVHIERQLAEQWDYPRPYLQLLMPCTMPFNIDNLYNYK